MQPTERLYFTDSSILDFSATVLEVIPGDGLHKVVLDRSAFYPTGGGQPHDTGTLGTCEVVDVFEDEGGTIYHMVRGAHGLVRGQTVSGSIARARRLDHMQQHSGQHILSQAFIQRFGAETRSFHLSAAASTIDIEMGDPTDEHMRQAEELANSVIFDDRPMRVHFLSEEEAARAPLRKESAVRGTVRVIEVEDFDWSPCGGTHAQRTGQVGLIAVRSFERAKRMTRVEFVCGARALADYRLANNTAVSVARAFSAERDSSPELVARVIQENRSLKKRLKELRELAMEAEAARMLSQAAETGPFKVVSAVFDGRELEEVKILASKIVSPGPAVALFATRDSEAARLVFARSKSLPHNMGELMAEACKTVGGRGGGKPDMAQGGGPDFGKAEEAINLARMRASGWGPS